METSKPLPKEVRSVERLFAVMAESSLQDTDAEVLREAGPNASEKAERVRACLLDGVKAFKQRALDRALVAYREEVRRYKQKQFVLPEKSADRRELLHSVFNRFPQGEKTFLTLQHREFKNLSDSDVESLLKQLEALGVLNGESR
jgi:hypothetical protein